MSKIVRSYKIYNCHCSCLRPIVNASSGFRTSAGRDENDGC